MKKSLIMVLVALVFGFSGCVKDLEKENFSETTTLIGRVIEESSQKPIAGVKVSITNGSRTYTSCTTEEDGNFELKVNFDKIDKDYYLLMDGGTTIKTKKSELRGMGMEMYDYTNIILYNSMETDGLSVVSFEITSFTAYSADCKAEIIAGTDVNVTKRGFCWSSSNQNPIVSNHTTENGLGAGEYTGIISGLSEKTKYYVRGYAQTTDTVIYSETKAFTTKPLYSTIQYNGITYTVYHEVEAMTWDAAMAYCESLTASGFDDWYLPDRDELNALYMNSSSIEGLTNDKYWSSAEYSSSQAYYLDFETGEQNYSNKTTTYKVRPVRTGQNTQTKPTVVTGDITNVTQNSAKCSGNVTDNGGSLVTKRGVCYSKTANPTLSDLHVSNGSGVGSFTCSIPDLELNTQYYVCAYATNSAGTSYGTPKPFKTHKIPTVSTGIVTDITSNSAKCKGNISSDGDCYVQSRGICWSTVSNPTINNNTATSGSGLGEYTCEMKNLASNTTYYVRAFAKYAGDRVEYGQQRTFTTMLPLPTFEYGGCTYYVAPDPGNQMNWSNANSYCNNLSIYGLSGWRLPTKEELVQMYVERNSIGGFGYSQYYDWGLYWSKTYYGQVNNYGEIHDAYYSVRFYNGNIGYSWEENCLSVRPIRRVN